MAEFNFSLDDIKDYIEKEIPDSEKPELLELLSAIDSDKINLDAIGGQLFEENFIQGIGGEMPFERKDFISGVDWQKIQKEIYLFLCTEGRKKQFNTVKELINTLVMIIATALGISGHIITKVAIAFVIFAAKTGINIYCEKYKCILDNE